MGGESEARKRKIKEKREKKDEREWVDTEKEI